MKIKLSFQNSVMNEQNKDSDQMTEVCKDIILGEATNNMLVKYSQLL